MTPEHSRPAVNVAHLPVDHVADARRRIARRAVAGVGPVAAKIRANRARVRAHPFRALLMPWSV